jgi:hypothetical protein
MSSVESELCKVVKLEVGEPVQKAFDARFISPKTNEVLAKDNFTDKNLLKTTICKRSCLFLVKKQVESVLEDAVSETN